MTRRWVTEVAKGPETMLSGIYSVSQWEAWSSLDKEEEAPALAAGRSEWARFSKDLILCFTEARRWIHGLNCGE